MSDMSVQGYVRGRVQGVGFRQATVRQANKLGIDGWVRNLDDGSVEVMLCGEEPALEAMAAWLLRAALTGYSLTYQKLYQ